MRKARVLALIVAVAGCGPKHLSTSGDDGEATVTVDTLGPNPVFRWKLPGTEPNAQKILSIGITVDTLTSRAADWTTEYKREPAAAAPGVPDATPAR